MLVHGTTERERERARERERDLHSLVDQSSMHPFQELKQSPRDAILMKLNEQDTEILVQHFTNWLGNICQGC